MIKLIERGRNETKRDETGRYGAVRDGTRNSGQQIKRISLKRLR